MTPRLRVTEQNQGVHEFTVDWWRELPEEFRKADRAQGEALVPAWDGLNRDPRFVTGFDGWDRSNTSRAPWVASLTFDRVFEVTPAVPVLVRSWHTPRHTDTGEVDAVTVRHTVRDYTGRVVAKTSRVVSSELGVVDTWVTPDRFGRVHVSVEVSIAVPFTMDVLNAIHVGTRKVTFEELPDLAAFTTLRPYPLLRFMDGVGHQAGFLRDEARHLWDGDTVDPVHAPDAWMPFLAAMLGLPPSYTGALTPAQLRAHVAAFVEQGRPPIGSRRAVAEVAKQWLYNDKQVTVLPANALPWWPSPEDKALLGAVTGQSTSGRVLVSPTPPVPVWEYRWVGAANNSVSQAHQGGRLAGENRAVNPSFRLGLNGWVGTRCDLVRDTVTWETGGASMRVTPATGAGWYVITGNMTQPTRSYVRVRFRVFSNEARRVHPKMWFYGPDTTVTAASVVVPAGEWTTVEGRFLVDANRQHRVALVPAATDTSTGPVWVDRVQVARESWLLDQDFDGDTPDSSLWDVWVQTGGNAPKVYQWDPTDRWVVAQGDHTARANAVIAAHTRGDRDHTLLMLVRTDELPKRDLLGFQRFMESTGVIPAGHRLVCLEAKTTWDAWEAAMGETWADLESRVRAWTHDEAAGVALEF